MSLRNRANAYSRTAEFVDNIDNDRVPSAVVGGRHASRGQVYPCVVPLYLTEADVDALFDPADAVPIVEDSFLRLAAGEVVNQPRLRLQSNGRALALMGAVDTGLGIAGSKTYVSAFVVSLFDIASGSCIGIIEANRLGQLRTGAASGVAAKYLARPGARRLGIIGCGFQAETQVACIRAAVPTIEHVVAYCRSEERLADFCARVGAEPGETHRDAAAC